MDSIILASSSPRRRHILEKVRIPFIVSPVEVEERVGNGRNARSSVIGNSARKSRAAAAHFQSGLVLGVDTIVVFGGKVLGKPAGESEALKYLRMLSGNRHEVCSGITIRDAGSGKVRSSCSVTEVTFSRLDARDIERYLRSREWVDKAGGYAIQGEAALFVERISGSFYNVMGLPLEELAALLRRFGYFESEGRYAPRRAGEPCVGVKSV